MNSRIAPLLTPPKCETIYSHPLSKQTTMRVGGPASVFAKPLTASAAIDLLNECWFSSQPYKVIGKGSNLVFSDEGFAGIIIALTALRECVVEQEMMTVDAGVSLQMLLKVVANNGWGGAEYLYSIPGNVGGAICMNAGRGRGYGVSIADHVEWVEAWSEGRVLRLTADQCEFSYRSSLFRQGNHIILRAGLRFKPQEWTEGHSPILDRLKFVQKHQDGSYPNSGTAFALNFVDLPGLRGYRIGDAQFSKKTANWILNIGKATCADIESLMVYAERRHEEAKLPKPLREIEIVPYGR